MKIYMYSMRDNVRGFLAPTFDTSDAAALRRFNFEMSRPDTEYSFQRQDFSLYKIGEFDTDTGAITPCVLEVIA